MASVRRSAVGLGVLFAFSFLPTAQATVMVPLSIEEMSVRSSAVVRASVVNSRAEWDDAHQKIYTYTDLEVIDPIHTFQSLPAAITVRSLGGEVDSIGMKVSGTPHFSIGEEVLIFLRSDPEMPAVFQVVGMSQGKYRIERDPQGAAVAVPGLEGLAFARTNAAGVLEVDKATPNPERMPLGDLRRRIRAAIDAERPRPLSPDGTPPTVAPPTLTPPALRSPSTRPPVGRTRVIPSRSPARSN